MPSAAPADGSDERGTIFRSGWTAPARGERAFGVVDVCCEVLQHRFLNRKVHRPSGRNVSEEVTAVSVLAISAGTAGPLLRGLDICTEAAQPARIAPPIQALTRWDTPRCVLEAHVAEQAVFSQAELQEDQRPTDEPPLSECAHRFLQQYSTKNRRSQEIILPDCQLEVEIDPGATLAKAPRSHEGGPCRRIQNTVMDE